MAFEKFVENDPPPHLVSVPVPEDNLSLLPQVDIQPAKPVPKRERPTAPPGSYEWLDQEYKGIMAMSEEERDKQLVRFRNTVNNQSVTNRNRFSGNHPEFESFFSSRTFLTEKKPRT